MNTKKTFRLVDEYINTFPKETKIKLQQLRNIIRETAPEAEEIISYNMPAYKTTGVLVYFAGYKSHIGFYPTSSGIIQFKNELSVYKNSKGAVQFPLDKPLPETLIKKMVLYRLSETRERQATKKKQKVSVSKK